MTERYAHSLRASAAAHDRPAVMPADPARAGAERHEAEYVRKGRARGVSWQNLGLQLGVNPADLKRRHGGGA